MRLAELLRRTSHCGLGQKAGNPVRDTWLKFRPAYERRLIRGGRTGWTSSRRADGCRPTVRCERPYERAARQLIRRKAPRNQRCIIYFVRGREIDMQTPVDIAFRHCAPSEEIRSEIAAQMQRLEKFSPRITSCRVVVTGPQTGHRRGGFEVELRITMPEHNEVVVDKSHADAPEREYALVAIREAFDAAVRQIENVMHEFRGQVKHHAEASHGRVKNLHAGED
jgi:ribosome-associated translation inhibitor RaiA